MKKDMMIVKGLMLATGLALCQSVVADDLQAKITEDFKREIAFYYNNKGEVKLLTRENWFEKATPTEIDIFAILLPKFFEVVKAEASRWFWKGDYKKSDWWKALNEKDRKANKFMAYLYNINGVNAEKQWTDLGMSITPAKTMLFYSLNDNIFHKESISFFKRHWGKIALAGVLAAGAVGYAGYRYSGEIAPVIESGWGSLREGASNLYRDVTDLPGRVKSGYNRWQREKKEFKEYGGMSKNEYETGKKLKETQSRMNKIR